LREKDKKEEKEYLEEERVFGEALHRFDEKRLKVQSSTPRVLHSVLNIRDSNTL